MARVVTKAFCNDVLEILRGNMAVPANYFVALCTAATAPTIDTTILGQMTEIAQGAGYSAGGKSVPLNTTAWPSIVAAANVTSGSDVTSQVKMTAADIGFVATGGALPLSGAAARYAVLLTPHATPASRRVWIVWDLVDAVSVSSGQELKLDDPAFYLTAAFFAS